MPGQIHLCCNSHSAKNPVSCKYVLLSCAQSDFEIVRFTFPVWVENVLKPGALARFVAAILTYQNSAT